MHSDCNLVHLLRIATGPKLTCSRVALMRFWMFFKRRVGVLICIKLIRSNTVASNQSPHYLSGVIFTDCWTGRDEAQHTGPRLLLQRPAH